MADEPEITIQDLYPDLTPEQQQEAEASLRRYMDIIARIYERKFGTGHSSEEDK